MGSVDFGAVCAAVEKGNKIIDVRSRDEFTSGHIPGSVNIPVADIEQQFSLPAAEFRDKYGVDKPDLEKELIVSCKMGGRANKAKEKLVGMGYSNVLVYTGSFMDWEQNGGTIEK